MKRCPICQNTFDESLRFCQLDGTLLVDDAGGNLPVDPLNTLVGGAPIRDDEDDLLQLGDDATKTLISPPFDEAKNNNPSSPFGDSFSPSGSSPFSDESTLSSTPFGSQPVSPFDAPDYQSPSTPFSEATQQTSFNQSPFDAPQNSYGSPLQPSSWTPPPAPEAGWQSQNIGANTPFAPPVAGMGYGQNQTLPIISLVLGIISVLCCWLGFLTGPAALVTGYLGKKNADNNPNQYGGGGMALAGMITGGIGTLISVGYFLLIIIGAVSGSIR